MQPCNYTIRPLIQGCSLPILTFISPRKYIYNVLKLCNKRMKKNLYCNNLLIVVYI